MSQGLAMGALQAMLLTPVSATRIFISSEGHEPIVVRVGVAEIACLQGDSRGWLGGRNRFHGRVMKSCGAQDEHRWGI